MCEEKTEHPLRSTGQRHNHHSRHCAAHTARRDAPSAQSSRSHMRIACASTKASSSATAGARRHPTPRWVRRWRRRCCCARSAKPPKEPMRAPRVVEAHSRAGDTRPRGWPRGRARRRRPPRRFGRPSPLHPRHTRSASATQSCTSGDPRQEFRRGHALLRMLDMWRAATYMLVHGEVRIDFSHAEDGSVASEEGGLMAHHSPSRQ